MSLKKYLRLAAAVSLLSACVCNADALGAKRPPRAPRKPKPAQSKPFKPACASPSYPSPAPSASPVIDADCGIDGGGADAEGLQDSVKNNFCAKGAPKAITIPQLTSLQAQVAKNPGINFGNENKGTRKKGPTTNRAPLKKLGEGKLVTLHAYVFLARQEGGESVNCGKNVPDQPAFHDIHISLVASAASTETECSGVVAEMSPHHRPDSWTHANVDKVSRAQLPVRVTGQLYFDSSHFPCAGGKEVPGNPSRVSLWEIHPIYKFEVCTSKKCDDATGTWVALDQWAKQ